MMLTIMIVVAAMMMIMNHDVGHHTEVEYCHKGFSTQFGEDSAGDHSGPNRSK